MESNVDSDSFRDSVVDSPLSPLFCGSGELFTWEEIEKVSYILFSFLNHIFHLVLF
jgi:hypothetical protein